MVLVYLYLGCSGIPVFVGRRSSADGRRVTLAVKVSEGTAAAVDEARGELSRSAWLHAVLSATLGVPDAGVAGLAAAHGSSPERRAPARAAEPAAPAADGCPHPRARVLKGLCYACGAGVG
jgi:hypothetical protein